MQARYSLWMLAMLLGAAACSGGSGSSGFDAAPTENAAITLALQAQRCVEGPMLTVCPTNVAPPSTGSTPRKPGEVDVSLDQHQAVACVAADATCTFTLPFSSAGFSAGTTFRVAVRNVEPPGPWVLSVPPQPTGAPGTPDLEVPVAVDTPTETPSAPSRVQLAVLVFSEPPSALPAMLDELGNSGADFAYVTGALSLQPE